MRKFLIFYYNGNEVDLAIVETSSPFTACETLGDTGLIEMPWEESVNYVMDISLIPQEQYSLIQIMKNGHAGEFITLDQVSVL